MASEDIIELGSSDDETQPAPKKMKPMLNAMVHIPNSLHGVTIKPTKAKPASLNKVPIGKAIPNQICVPEVSTLIANAHLNKTKINGKALQTPVMRQTFKMQPKYTPVMIKTSAPTGLIHVTNAQPFLKKNPANVSKTALRIHSPKALNKLPPSITVTRTSAASKRINTTIMSNLNKKQKTVPRNTVGEVLTVELDDDDTSPSTAGPQWYMRPEEQDKAVESPESENNERLQEINDKEPKPAEFIEITIEDSPIKSIQNKRTREVGAELAITIDDSPVKSGTEKNFPASSSDDEGNASPRVPHSKKKLEYPKDAQTSTAESIEIEIEPMLLVQPEDFDTNKHEEKVVTDDFNNVVEIEESPIKPVENLLTSTPKKYNPVKLQVKSKEFEHLSESKKDLEEFHPIYQSFIDLCFHFENSDDMSKIVEKKIKTYYRQVPKEYTESEEFVDMVSSKIMAMKAGPEKMYLYIKDIVDELNLQRKLSKSQVLNKETKTAEPEKFVFGEDSEYDSKRQRQIRKLEKTLRKLHRAIQKLEEQEVDFDDEEDSVYLLTERYKERMVRVHAKFCQLTNTKMPSEPRVQIDARPGQPTGPAKRLEHWINRKVPIGTPLPFPDFHDVIRCVKEANQEDKLGWNDADIMEEARDLFTRCGRKLQRRRQENEWRLAASRISLDLDPAENNDDLKRKLEENKQLATKKETEVLNKYADRQNLLKLEAVEIGDKEADESPVESEDDEPIDESISLENSEKRKQRLKRLLKQKSKKVDDEKENQAKNEPIKGQNDVEMETTETNEDSKTAKEMESEQLDKKQIESTDPSNNENNENPNDREKTLSVSDDDKVESDIDELHLLQKLHSENEINTSTVDSSDTDTPIAISDTLSSSDNRKRSSDVISIENSSYSESENNHNYDELKDCVTVTVCHPSKGVNEEVVGDNEEMEYSTAGIEKKHNKTNNDEYNESVEDILLASSDEESHKIKDKSPKEDETCINLKDDSISIGETIIEKECNPKDNITVEDNENLNRMHNDNPEVSSVDVEIVSEKLSEELEQKPVSPISAEGVETLVDDLPESTEVQSQSKDQIEDADISASSSVNVSADQSDPKESVLEDIIGSISESNEANVKLTSLETVMV